jgi:hypothetical protein
MFNNVAADESGAAGDKDSHHSKRLLLRRTNPSRWRLLMEDMGSGTAGSGEAETGRI